MNFEDIELPSNKKFGATFVAIFCALAVYSYISMSLYTTFGFSFLAAIVLFVTITKSELLRPFNVLWMRFGFLLGKIVSPIVLGVIFFLLFTPIAIAMRIAGRDELRLKLGNKDSHWKQRLPSEPYPYNFDNQF